MRPNSPFGKLIATVVAMTTANLSMPWAAFVPPAPKMSEQEREAMDEAQRPELAQRFAEFMGTVYALRVATFGTGFIHPELDVYYNNAADLGRKLAASFPAPKPQPSRALSLSEMTSLKGMSGANPYFSGTTKFSMDIAGVDLMTGNMTTGAQDLGFEVGYGIPVNVTRTYSLNNSEEGPFGWGWTLSADVRSAAGGVAKSAGAPTRSVPVTIQERHPSQRAQGVAPNSTAGLAEPVEAVQSFDPNATYDTIARDVDGVWTPPGYDSNIHDTIYERVPLNGQEYEVALKDTILTPDGMTYVYEKQGSYVAEGGTGPMGMRNGFDSSTETDRVPSNILKLTSAFDRQGNETKYIYATTNPVTFQKFAGTVTENRLTRVEMPSGQAIDFTWVGNRITAITDGTRTVTYTYTGSVLTKVTAPDGGETLYQYDGEGNLKKITDPRGLATEYKVEVSDSENPRSRFPYYENAVLPGLYVEEVLLANGLKYLFDTQGYGVRAQLRTSAGGLVDAITVNQLYNPTVDGTIGISYEKGNEHIKDIPATPTGYSVPVQYRFFNVRDQSLIKEISWTGIEKAFKPGGSSLYDYQDWADTRWNMVSQNQPVLDDAKTIVEYQYNFQQKPLREETWSFTNSPQANPTIGDTIGRRSSKEYAYWGWDKYMQEKAVRVRIQQKGGTSIVTQRISMKDYYDRNTDAGKKGQVKATYVSQIDTTNANTFVNAPAPTDETPANGASWKGAMTPGSAIPSSTMDYDAQGRVIQTNLLHKVNGSTKTYSRSKMTYGSPVSPWYGGAASVEEGIQVVTTGTIFDSGLTEDLTNRRTTMTLAYDTAGRTLESKDAMGREFKNIYDNVGRMLATQVKESNGSWRTLTSIDYGTTKGTVEFGQPFWMVDHTDAIISMISYVQAGPGIGQIHMSDEWGDPLNGFQFHGSSTEYTYNEAGERATVKYSNFDDPVERMVAYNDYVPVGLELGKRAFQTVQVLSPTGSATSEEFHYQYDSAGRIIQSAFAQTPSTQATTAGAHGSFYGTHNARSRARAVHNYNEFGELTSLNYYWDCPEETTPSQLIASNVNVYDNLGRRTSTAYNYDGTWTESFGYATNLDYLTSASYSDNSNWNGTWGYDAAQNRSDVTTDILNRITGKVGNANVSYAHNAVGERTLRTNLTPGNQFGQVNGKSHYQWSELGRLRQFKSTINFGQSDQLVSKYDYRYRQDGLRVAKIGGLASTGSVELEEESSSYWDEDLADNSPTWRYSYDGQMPVWEDYYRYEGGHHMVWDVTRSTLGGRGIDMIERQRMSDKENPNPGTASRVFPLYDGHGNTMGELARTGATSYAVGNLRKYDAWGNSRLNSAPSGFHGYCGNLGHKEDPESGLTYMRARYYEPGTGRFISQDPAYDGLNWYAYCGGNPVGRVDQSGKAWTVDWVIAGMAALSSFIVTLATTQNVGAAMVSLVSGFIVGLAAAMSSDAPKKSAMVVLMESTVGKFFAGGLANAAATWIVNAITGTETGIGDLVIAFICGGTGASFGSGMDLDEAFQGFIAGVLSSAGQKLIPSAIETFRA